MNFFNSNIKLSGKYDPKFRIKVDNHSLFFGPKCENLTPETLEDGLFRSKTFTALVQLKGVYFFKQQMGLTWTVVEAKVYEPKKAQGPHLLPPDVTGAPASWADDDEQTPKLQKFSFKIV